MVAPPDDLSWWQHMSAVDGPAAESENRCWSLLKGYAANDAACPERPTSWLAKAQRPGASKLANGEIAFAGVRSHASSSTFPREPQMVWADKVRWGSRAVSVPRP